MKKFLLVGGICAALLGAAPVQASTSVNISGQSYREVPCDHATLHGVSNRKGALHVVSTALTTDGNEWMHWRGHHSKVNVLIEPNAVTINNMTSGRVSVRLSCD